MISSALIPLFQSGPDDAQDLGVGYSRLLPRSLNPELVVSSALIPLFQSGPDDAQDLGVGYSRLLPRSLNPE
ncbi:hypothetical protein, partial [Nocardia brasiliensis]|uniref:hypothetical protein n=1 Tax=Nocardia brasiliensis TaxID=37326 RepID=UPI0024553913